MVEIKGLRKVYRLGQEKVVALDSVDLSIGRREVCCLLGPSGSGKSTLLNMMAGLERPTKGTVAINGRLVTSMSEKQLAAFRQSNIGFIFQAYNLLPNITAMENVALPLMIKHVPSRLRNARAAAMLRMVGLGSHLRHKPMQMSGGQQQRVGIARALVTKPPILFADEPTGNLDSKTSAEVMDILLGISRLNGITLILVTHDSDIARYADKVVYIQDGNVGKIEVRAEMPQTARHGGV
ncbi:MAG: ABC transporter ATP-binding protein [Oscillospiraceae bacterium]|nr:ABC transporter ATP-binding protein [Oscillospiraceae bacterium]